MRRLPALEKQWAHEKLSDVGRTVRFGAIAGALVPYLFLLGTIGISWLEEDFMERLGWEVWPSGLALGPDGWLQIVNFIAFGVLLIAFALAVAAVPARNRWVKAAPILLGLAGVAAVMLSFKTDPPDVEETWHGIAHGVAYLTWLASIVIAYPFTWWRVRGHASWTMAPAWPSLLALLLFPPVLLLPDSESAGNYVFFSVVMTPLTAIATRMAVGAMRAPPARGNEETAISVVLPPHGDNGQAEGRRAFSLACRGWLLRVRTLTVGLSSEIKKVLQIAIKNCIAPRGASDAIQATRPALGMSSSDT